MLTRFSDFRDWPFPRLSGVPRAFGTFEDVRRQVDRLLSEFEPEAGEASPGRFPRIEFEDQGAAFVVRAELPGVLDKDVDLSVTATTVTLRGERKTQAPEGYAAHRNERAAFRFARSFELPQKVDPERVEARLEHGVLTVTLPKVPESQPKQIAVKAS